MSNPLISIITPAYKADLTIGRAALSVLHQTLSDWELIIVSDDQQDYEKLLRDQGINDQRLRYLSTGCVGSGSSNARNQALRAARGRFIACLDADDVFLPAKLAQLLPLAQVYGAAVSDIEFRDDRTNDLLDQYNRLPSGDAASVRQIIPACIQTYSVYLYDRSRIPDLFYDPDLLRAQDLVYLMSFFNSIDRIGVAPEKLHIYYRRQGSAFNSADTHQKSHEYKLRIIDKLNRGKLSINNEAARHVTRLYMQFSLEVDALYDQAVLADPATDWVGIFSSELEDRFLAIL